MSRKIAVFRDMKIF